MPRATSAAKKLRVLAAGHGELVAEVVAHRLKHSARDQDVVRVGHINPLPRPVTARFEEPATDNPLRDRFRKIWLDRAGHDVGSGLALNAQQFVQPLGLGHFVVVDPRYEICRIYDALDGLVPRE